MQSAVSALQRPLLTPRGIKLCRRITSGETWGTKNAIGIKARSTADEFARYAEQQRTKPNKDPSEKGADAEPSQTMKESINLEGQNCEKPGLNFAAST